MTNGRIRVLDVPLFDGNGTPVSREMTAVQEYVEKLTAASIKLQELKQRLEKIERSRGVQTMSSTTNEPEIVAEYDPKTGTISGVERIRVTKFDPSVRVDKRTGNVERRL